MVYSLQSVSMIRGLRSFMKFSGTSGVYSYDPSLKVILISSVFTDYPLIPEVYP